jgi:prepilin-type N-terminal cleavage/methylation domain-containing protein
MKSQHTQQGFTIIETLVAITILMISVVGPLTIAHKGLRAAVDAGDTVTASYLAQDAIEYLKNIRDNNLLKHSDWLRVLRNCTESSPCKVNTREGDPAEVWTGVESCPSASCLVPATKFKRHFYLLPRTGDESMQEETHLVVVMRWTSGALENEIIYENEMFNVLK